MTGISRREWLKRAGAAGTAAMAAGSFAPAAGAQGTRPNIIFIMSDDHASHAISAYTDRLVTTPNIDRIANEGVRLDNCFCTNSICAPSRAAILTGQYGHINSVTRNGQRFDPPNEIYPEILQRNGYRTAMIGKWHLQSPPMGFDYWRVLPGQGHYYNPDFRTPDGVERIHGYCTDIITDLTVDWLRQQGEGDAPFLLCCQHKAPHREWMPGPEEMNLFKDHEFPEPPDLLDDYETRGSAARMAEMTLREHFSPGSDMKLGFDPAYITEDWAKRRWNSITERMDDEQRAMLEADFDGRAEYIYEEGISEDERVRRIYQVYMRDYLRCIKGVDKGVGRILDTLDELGLADNTLIVYTSDQGFYLGDHGWYDKRFMYEESLRMPFAARWPGHIPAGSATTDICVNIDFAPAFLAAAGVDAPAYMQGANMLPVLTGDTPNDWREAMYYHYVEFPAIHQVNKHYGVRTGRYKLICFYELQQWELYDLEADPHEVDNVFGKEDYAETAERLHGHLMRLRAKYNDTEGPDVPPLPAAA